MTPRLVALTYCFKGLYHQDQREVTNYFDLAVKWRTGAAYSPVTQILIGREQIHMSWQSDLEHCIRPDEPLAPHCWLRLGGKADFFAEPTNHDDLQKIAIRCQEQNLPLRTLGGGSNLLVSDDGVRGVVLSLLAPAFCDIAVKGEVLTAGGGTSLSHAIVYAVREGLAGLESLVSVPGTVGGALHGNAGDKIASVGNCFQSATVMTRAGELLNRDHQEIAFSYRQSSLDDLAIIDASFKLEQENKEELARRMQKRWIVTRSEQPAREKRTACLFKNPMGQSASDLIGSTALRNHRVGAVGLYERDPNYVVVGEGGTSDDVKRLMEDVRENVNLSRGVELESALQVW